ncbi:MAG: Unknown protein [uncultured Thiotrichaceae bacterium]|uniref:DUF11 domain-containing protein n=1 Tax=uncultured Thiotrichaceae bacterium TaxID=298394 RepID=A0A6S6U4C4_9GAMM|nr:MAG: Unknown protein [uncultured Thiotrichaceae bacterium]
MKKNNNNKPFLSALLMLSMFFSMMAYAASPVAGTLIQNQASATYKDAGGVSQFATSNIVETVIQQVGALDLIQNQEKQGAAGNTIYFPHVLTNTGNGEDTYTLSAINQTGDGYDFSSFQIYADKNRDGVADSTTSITETDLLSAGEAFYFVVAAEVPVGAGVGTTGDIEVKGKSQFLPDEEEKTNIDKVTVTDQAVIDVTKSISGSEGASPSGTYKVTLSYVNNGAQTATNVTLIDALPAGMTYAGNSGEWSVESALALTDAGPSDSQGSGDTIIFCAYDASCTGLLKGAENTGSDSTTQLTAIIASVPAGDSGTLSFDVNIKSDLKAQILYNTAEYTYDGGSTPLPTNKVPFEVLEVPGVVANGSITDATDGVGESVTVATAPQGSIVSFNNIIWNKGNTVDTFEMTIDTANDTFPTGTVFQLFKSDGFTPLLDTNGEGTKDTGPIEPNAYYTVVLKAFLPAGEEGSTGYDVTKTATSSIDSSVFNTVTDHLQTIVAETVDLTNDVANTLGAGNDTVQSASSPVTTKTVAPGEQAVFLLNVNNEGTEVRNYILEYSKEKPFVAGSLDSGWNVTFHRDGGSGDCSTLGAEITATGNIAGAGNKQLCAAVDTPVDASGNGVVHPIYFRVFSSANNAEDIKFDAVVISVQPSVGIEPDQVGNIEPGGTVVYNHRIFNNGNTPLECLDVASSNTTTGWSSVIYLDVNNDGALDSDDTLLTNQTLAVGASFPILVKMFAPANAALGSIDTTTLTVTGNQDDGDSNPATCTGTAVTDNVTDITTASTADVNIVKTQALDSDCNGVDEGGYSSSTFSVPAQSCVMYRLTATNAGSTPVNNVRINDAAPVFTSFFGTASTTHGNITGGVAGDDGSIAAGSVSGASITLQSGQQMVLDFSIRLE